MLRANATRFPDVPAYVEGGAAVTHAELLARAGRLLGAWRAAASAERTGSRSSAATGPGSSTSSRPAGSVAWSSPRPSDLHARDDRSAEGLRPRAAGDVAAGPDDERRDAHRRRPTGRQRRLSPVTGDAPRARRDQTRHPAGPPSAGPPTRSHTCRQRADEWGATASFPLCGEHQPVQKSVPATQWLPVSVLIPSYVKPRPLRPRADPRIRAWDRPRERLAHHLIGLT
jgi:hypothetical protein